MNTEVQLIIRRLERTLQGEPWFGRSVYEILGEVDTKKVYLRPANAEHALIDILYHMNTWSDFTLKRLEKDSNFDLAIAEELDWRTIDPKLHTWKKGLAEFKSINKKILTLLEEKDDDFLREIVDYRKYNYSFLLHGMIEHHIYHLGQVALLKKML